MAAQLYNLQHVVPDIQDSKYNETRFILVHNKDHETPTGKDRTTLLYEVPNAPAALYNGIGAFSRRGLNLSGQHSIATGIRLGRYGMLTEVGAHRSDSPMQRALKELAEELTIPNSIYILGSYPRYTNNTQ